MTEVNILLYGGEENYFKDVDHLSFFPFNKQMTSVLMSFQLQRAASAILLSLSSLYFPNLSILKMLMKQQILTEALFKRNTCCNVFPYYSVFNTA